MRVGKSQRMGLVALVREWGVVGIEFGKETNKREWDRVNRLRMWRSMFAWILHEAVLVCELMGRLKHFPWTPGSLAYLAEWRVDMGLNSESYHVLLLWYGAMTVNYSCTEPL